MQMENKPADILQFIPHFSYVKRRLQWSTGVLVLPGHHPRARGGQTVSRAPFVLERILKKFCECVRDSKTNCELNDLYVNCMSGWAANEFDYEHRFHF